MMNQIQEGVKDRFIVRNFGPIQEIDVELGDLTVLVGAQASGKSLFLQMFKLIKDKDAILESLENYGFVVNKQAGKPVGSLFRRRLVENVDR